MENNGILEMNCSENPEWTKEFQTILINEYKISKIDAIFIVGEALHCIRKYNK